MASSSPILDLAIIGGGINGAGIARDAAGRGLAVALFEKGDLASGTSSASTKLIHGGLRYLEHYAFRLVRESLQERERLLRIAPHIIWPLRFILPQVPGMRPAWLLRLGLFLYDHIGGREILPPTRRVDLRAKPFCEGLAPHLETGFEYSDLWADDARFVVLNARDAARRGASIHTRCRVVTAIRETIAGQALWRITAESADGGRREHAARILINAGGPWAGTIANGVIGLNKPARVRMVKGSHIVLRRLFPHDRAFILQNSDGRITFAIPYEQYFTLIGTTDLDYHDEPGAVRITADEERYLLAAASAMLAKPLAADDIVWRYSGVRPLYDDGASKAQEATRDYVLSLDAPTDAAPALSVFGGKLTTYRRLAEHALADLAPHLPTATAAERTGWTARAALPGGDFPFDGFEALIEALARDFAFLPRPLAYRLCRAYGTEARTMLGDATSLADLGTDFGAGLTRREVEWLRREEWAATPEDILWRRSKLGLHMTAEQREAFAAMM